ncbi:GGDEF domain-containing protein [Persicimonas caeni]|nr:GGDEF domain-containing protein [Persicimonas caeni]
MAEKSDLELVKSEDDEITIDVPPDAFEESFAEETERNACLVFLSGPVMGHTVSLSESPKVVGRADDADLVITDEGVSRRHARFYLREQGGYVEDLNSSNGVYVNGQRIERFAHLEQGDKITLGTDTILKFTYHDHLDEDFQQRLLDAAIKDPLTQVHNRAFFDQKFDSEFGYAARYGDQIALILFDLDHFKKVNDTHGHLAGDAVLEKLGSLLNQTVRTEDFVARYGGEEFAMICRGASLEQAWQAAERLRKLVEQNEFTHDGEELAVTISAGVASYPEQEVDSASELIDAADRALYASKQNGRNRATKAD